MLLGTFLLAAVPSPPACMYQPVRPAPAATHHASPSAGKAGVSFSGPAAVGYRANLWLRAAIRVLRLQHETLLDARQPAGEAVYDAFREAADWARLLEPGQSFSLEGRVWSCSNLSSSQVGWFGGGAPSVPSVVVLAISLTYGSLMVHLCRLLGGQQGAVHPNPHAGGLQPTRINQHVDAEML